ncbi:hypothetical protein BGLA2_2840002 [Burkholderia gladioli]|nr:hypothetical protein BGLA2_2840002 [Burkholderia gladioli]
MAWPARSGRCRPTASPRSTITTAGSTSASSPPSRSIPTSARAWRVTACRARSTAARANGPSGADHEGGTDRNPHPVLGRAQFAREAAAGLGRRPAGGGGAVFGAVVAGRREQREDRHRAAGHAPAARADDRAGQRGALAGRRRAGRGAHRHRAARRADQLAVRSRLRGRAGAGGRQRRADPAQERRLPGLDAMGGRRAQAVQGAGGRGARHRAEGRRPGRPDRGHATLEREQQMSFSMKMAAVTAEAARR